MAAVVSVVAVALLHGQHVVSVRRTDLQHELHFVEVHAQSDAVVQRRNVRHVHQFYTQQPVEDHRYLTCFKCAGNQGRPVADTRGL